MGARLHRAGQRARECRDRTPHERRDAHRAAVRRGHAPPVTLAHPLLRYPVRSLLLDRRSLHGWRQDVDDAMAADRGSPHRAGAVHGSARTGEEADEVTERGDPRAAFIEAACVPLDRGSGHATGTLERAEAILATHPDVATGDVHTAAILGDDRAVRRFLALDGANATAKAGPRQWDALTHLCFSRYLRLDRARSDGFVRAATALLDAGASANTGWFETNHQPQPAWESALYGAAGVAHHAELTRLLLERGADPNDGEVPYHAPEGDDNEALKALVESGKLNDDSLATMLLRKADWHDYEGIQFLLAHGADPNRMTGWRLTALHQALRRDNAVENIEAMLDHGADPTLKNGLDDKSAVALGARRGRGDVLELFERRGILVELHGVERLIAACARSDAAAIDPLVEREPRLL